MGVIGSVKWDVVWGGTGMDGLELKEEEPDTDLNEHYCLSGYRDNVLERLEEWLWTRPPLFEQEAKFEPKFRLDGFVAGLRS